MANITVRNLPDEVHRALRIRAAQHGRSTEAEVREILAAAVLPEERVRVGDALAAIGQETKFTDDDAELINSARDKTPATPMSIA